MLHFRAVYFNSLGRRRGCSGTGVGDETHVILLRHCGTVVCEDGIAGLVCGCQQAAHAHIDICVSDKQLMH
jgi:hypothetical protein